MSIPDELRAAARTLRTIAKLASRGPWEDFSTDDEGAWPRYLVGRPAPGDDPQAAPEVIKVHESIADHEVVCREDMAWIALVHPGLAEPLAAWLDRYAAEAEASLWPEDSYFHGGCGNRMGDGCRCFTEALAVARVLNGTEEETSA